MANLHQLNVQFVPQEDRLILRVRSDDNSEIRAWLTRRYTRLLLGILEKILDRDRSPTEDAVQSAMRSFQRDAALNSADFASDYDPSATAHPLGTEPVLLTTIKYQLTDKGITILTLGLPDGKTLGINLSKGLIHVFIKLLEEGTKSADWDLAAAAGPGAGAGPGDPVARTFH